MQILFKTYSKDYNLKNKKGNRLALKKMAIAIAGPLTNLVIVGIAMVLNKQELTSIIYANLLLIIFNLIPIYPLDGGRILKEALHIYLGREKAYEIANSISKVVIVLLTIITSIAILYIHNIAFVIILAYLWYLVITNEKKYMMKKRIYEAVKKQREEKHKISACTFK